MSRRVLLYSALVLVFALTVLRGSVRERAEFRRVQQRYQSTTSRSASAAVAAMSSMDATSLVPKGELAAMLAPANADHNRIDRVRSSTVTPRIMVGEPTPTVTGVPSKAPGTTRPASSPATAAPTTPTNALPTSACTGRHFQEGRHWNCRTRTFQRSCAPYVNAVPKDFKDPTTNATSPSPVAALKSNPDRDDLDLTELIRDSGILHYDNVRFAGDSLSRNRFMTAAVLLSGDYPLRPGTCPGAERALEYFVRHCQQSHCLHRRYERAHCVRVPGTNRTVTLHHDNAAYEAKKVAQAMAALGPKDIVFFSMGTWINYSLDHYLPHVRRAMERRPNHGETVIWIGPDAVGHLKPPEHVRKGQNNTSLLAYNRYMKDHHEALGFDGYVDFWNLTKAADDCAAASDEPGWANFDGTHFTAEPNRMILLGILTHLKEMRQRKRTSEEN